MLAITRSSVCRLAKRIVFPVYTKTAKMAHAWGYASSDLPPDRWYEDYPIAKGKKQSPIDIIGGTVKAKSFVPFKIGYDASGVKSLNNNGHSVTFMASGAGSVAGGPLKSRYTLEQFHFHWGSDSTHGSEHLLDGKSFAAELHLVHWNSEKYGSFAESLDHPDGLCVLGAFLQPGHCENPNYKQLVEEVKSVPFKGDTRDVSKGFDPRKLLPEDVGCYFHYGGSLTTPPLKECVQWVVFKNPVDVSESQLQAFRDLHFGGKESPCMCNNYRPTQELCARDVYSS